MIRHLYISNYAIIDNLEIDFLEGFTTITGSTGAGKSILLGALHLLLGSRFDSVNFKDKSKKCIVEGEFFTSNLLLEQFFLDQDIDYEQDIIIRREFLFEGKSRSFINDTPVKLDVLKKMSFFLLDIHSQHENLLIHNQNFQVHLLDSYARKNFKEFNSLLDDYSSSFNLLRSLRLDLQGYEKQLQNPDLDFIYNQEILEEIGELNLQFDEKDKLENDYEKLNNIQEIKQILLEVLFLFEDGESTILNNFNLVVSKLSSIKKYDSKIDSSLIRLEQGLIDIKDVLIDLRDLNHGLTLNHNKLEFVENRLNTINGLERKLNVFNFSDLMNKIKELKNKLKNSKNIHQNIVDVKNKIETLKQEMTHLANRLTSFRKKSSVNLLDLIKNDLSNLGISNPQLSFSFSELLDFSSSGLDSINLLFSANKGYELKKVTEIASGGEISRLMLCVKKHLFAVNNFSSIIFDEIDAGVSGEIGRKMGRVLKDMSQTRQVICITHLPQIASLGDTHYYVYKDETKAPSKTKMIKLTDSQRIEEIARMLSGDEVNDEAFANAKKMLDI